MSKRGYAAIGLDKCKDKLNLGSVLRAAHCYDATLVTISGGRIPKKYFKTDPSKAYKHIPTFWVEDIKDFVPDGCTPVAIEFLDNAESLINYKHPEKAFISLGEKIKL